MGHNQEDMKEGLLAYIDEDKRSDYNNGLFKKKNVIKEIKRRLKESWTVRFDRAYLLQSNLWRSQKGP